MVWDAINDALVSFTSTIDNFMYTYILVILLVLVGIWFSFRTKFVQIRYIKDMFTALAGKSAAADTEYEKKFKDILEKDLQGILPESKEAQNSKAAYAGELKKKKRVSSFQALMVSTASRVGTGNIAGIATAVAMGGPGAVFWMWLMAIIGAASAFIESTLAQIWKVRNPDGSFRGGPAYYIQQGLGKRWLGIVFAVSLILCFAFGFNGLQTFNMTSALDYYVPDDMEPLINPVIGILAAIATAVVIFGGTNRISVISSILVPVMAISYIGIAILTSVIHWYVIPEALQLVFTEAFSPASFAGGFAGSCIMWGIKRGLFSNEAGMGSAPNAAATADVSHPCKQGLVQTLSVYIDTLLICTSSAFLILIYYVQQPEAAAAYNGMELVQQAMSNSIGEIGIHFITVAIVLFAYSSLVGNYLYAESNMLFIKDNKKTLLVFRIFCLVAIFLGSTNSFDLAWNLSDIFMGFMAIINLIAILLLGKWAIKALDDYTYQRKLGVNPVFVAANIEGLPATQWWIKGDFIDIGKDDKRYVELEDIEEMEQDDARKSTTEIREGTPL